MIKENDSPRGRVGEGTETVHGVSFLKEDISFREKRNTDARNSWWRISEGPNVWECDWSKQKNERRSRRAEEANRREEKIRVSVVSGVWWVYLEKVESLQHHHHHSRIVQCGVSNILHFLSDLQNNIIVCRAEAEYSELAGRNRVCVCWILNGESLTLHQSTTKKHKKHQKYVKIHKHAPSWRQSRNVGDAVGFGWFDSSRAEKRTDQNNYDPPSLRGTTWQRSSDQRSRRPSGTGCHRTSTCLSARECSLVRIILYFFDFN